MENETIVIYQWDDGPNVCRMRLYHDGAALLSGRMPTKSVKTKEFVCSPNFAIVVSNASEEATQEQYPAHIERDANGTGRLVRRKGRSVKVEAVAELDVVWLDDRFDGLTAEQKVKHAVKLALEHRAAIAKEGL